MCPCDMILKAVTYNQKVQWHIHQVTPNLHQLLLDLLQAQRLIYHMSRLPVNTISHNGFSA
jgi:hypothetical protein